MPRHPRRCRGESVRREVRDVSAWSACTFCMMCSQRDVGGRLLQRFWRTARWRRRGTWTDWHNLHLPTPLCVDRNDAAENKSLTDQYYHHHCHHQPHHQPCLQHVWAAAVAHRACDILITHIVKQTNKKIRFNLSEKQRAILTPVYVWSTVRSDL